MGSVSFIHSGLSNATWLFFLILGIWGTVRAIRGQGVDGSYIGAVAIGQLIFVMQAILGALLWISGLGTVLARPGIHYLYGIFALLFVPFIYFSVLRGDDSNRGQWVMAFSTLFMFGIALRLITVSAG